MMWIIIIVAAAIVVICSGGIMLALYITAKTIQYSDEEGDR